MKAYSMEIRECVIRAMEKGELTQEEIAELFGVSSRWVRWLYQRWLTTGKLEPLPHGGGFPPKITPAVELQLRKYLEEHPDATLAEIRRDCGLSVSLAAICQALQRLGLRRKKKSCSPLSESDLRFRPNAWPRSTKRARSTRIAWFLSIKLE